MRGHFCYSNMQMHPIESAASCQTAYITLRNGSLLSPLTNRRLRHLAPVSLTAFFCFCFKVFTPNPL